VAQGGGAPSVEQAVDFPILTTRSEVVDAYAAIALNGAILGWMVVGWVTPVDPPRAPSGLDTASPRPPSMRFLRFYK